MLYYKMRYGNGELTVPTDEKNLLGVVESNEVVHSRTEEQVILDALKKPIASAPLKELVKPGDTICIIVSDTTRAWQKMSFYLPYIVDELNAAGIKDSDITFLCATGSHRAQTPEEHKALVGEDLYKRFKVIDHNCFNEENLVYVGTTTFGTPVKLNKIALNSTHVILTGAIVYHFLAGWGGGKKSILPGISSYETIMKNHALSLNPEIGSGSNPEVKSGKIINNPVHEDMLEAASFINPSFLFNVIVDSDGKIIEAVAGNYVKAHEEGCKLIDKMERVQIKEKADLVIASQGGFPKDINLYQTIKVIVNAREATKEGGTIIILSECSEGFGNDEVKEMIQSYDNMYDREKALRANYSIAKYVGYYIAETAEKYNFIIVTNIPAEDFSTSKVHAVKTIDEALLLYSKLKQDNSKTYLMPHGASTLPQV
jgi:lactate racemase